MSAIPPSYSRWRQIHLKSEILHSNLPPFDCCNRGYVVLGLINSSCISQVGAARGAAVVHPQSGGGRCLPGLHPGDLLFPGPPLSAGGPHCRPIQHRLYHR